MKNIKKIGMAMGIVALVGVLGLIQGQAQVSGKATWNMGNYIELNVIGGTSLDCDFGQIDDPRPNYLCNPKAQLQVKSNGEWVLTTVKSAYVGAPDPRPVIRASDSPNCQNGATKDLPSGKVLVDFGTNSGQVEGKGNQIFQVCYALKGGDIGQAGTLGALSANTAYAVTFTYTATKK
ncbi:MAG: hypothetical protein ACK4HB_01575 [Candidatus Bipolaricaulia bacterium]